MSPKRKRRSIYVKASPVTVTHADGTTEQRKVLSPSGVNKIVGDGNRHHELRVLARVQERITNPRTDLR